MKKFRMLYVVVIILLALPSVTWADDAGRFQVVHFESHERITGMYILDTAEGHLWIYAAYTTEDGEQTVRIRYLGRVPKDGKYDIGEIVEQKSYK